MTFFSWPFLQNKFEKTATLMRHHHRSHDLKRQNLALLLDPFTHQSAVSSASNPNYIDHLSSGGGLNDHHGLDRQEEPIFVPHREKVSLFANTNGVCIYARVVRGA